MSLEGFDVINCSSISLWPSPIRPGQGLPIPKRFTRDHSLHHLSNGKVIGFEIIQILGPNELRAWIGLEITREEFAALEVPAGWIKNQPREGGEDVDGPDGGRFLRSPDATEDGEFLQEEFFGYNWFHAATIVQAGRALDDERILTGSSVRKFHELDFNAGSSMVLLISPEGSVYFRIGRDA